MADILRHLTRHMVRLVGLALLGVAILVSIEVILRKTIGLSLNAGSELSSYVLGLVATWGFSFALFERVHIRIDVLTRLLPKRLCCYADILAVAGLTLFSLLLSWFGFQSLLESLNFNSRSMTPLSIPMWIPQGLWAFGLVVFSVCCLTQAVRGCVLILKGRLDEAAGLLGNPTAADEAEAEMKPID